MNMGKTVALLAGLAIAFNVSATSVMYQATNVGGEVWNLTYDVTNNSLAVPISELTIYFNPAVFSNLAVGPSQPPGWNAPIAVPADPTFLPDLSGYAFFDTVASNSGIAANATLIGFTALVDYSGSGIPNSQVFQVVDPSTFETLDQGTTTLSDAGTSVPEPAILALLVLGFLAVLKRFRHSTHRTFRPS